MYHLLSASAIEELPVWGAAILKVQDILCLLNQQQLWCNGRSLLKCAKMQFLTPGSDEFTENIIRSVGLGWAGWKGEGVGNGGICNTICN